MKKTSIILALVFVFVLSFSFGILAEDITARKAIPTNTLLKKPLPPASIVITFISVR